MYQNSNLVRAIVLWSFAAVAAVAQQPNGRYFTDQSGKFRVRAIVVDLDETNVKLKKLDGTEITVPLERLCDSDQKFLREKLRQYKEMAGDFPIGTKVQIKSTGGWYPGVVLQVQPGKYFVKFDDYSDTWNKWVTASELKLIQEEKVVKEKASDSPATTTDAAGSQASEKAAPATEMASVVPSESAIPILKLEALPPTPPIYLAESINSRQFLSHTSDKGWSTPINPTVVPALSNATFQLNQSPSKSPFDEILPSVRRQRSLVIRGDELFSLNLAQGKIDWRTTIASDAGAKPLAISDDGQRLIFSLFNNLSQPTGLCVYRVDGESAVIEWVWRPVPESHEVQTAKTAYWLSNDRVAVADNNGFSVWNPLTRSQHAIIIGGNGVTPIDFSSGGDFVAFYLLGHVTVYPTKNILPLVNTIPIVSGAKQVSFSPTGKSILVSGEGLPTIISAINGKLTPLDAAVLNNAKVQWIDDRFALVNGESIFDMQRNSLVWQFNLVSSGKPAGSISTMAGKLVVSQFNNSKLLVRSLFDMVDPEAIKPPPPKLAFRPGAKFAIRIAGNLADKYRGDIEAYLNSIAKQNGWIVEANSPLAIQVDVNEFTKPITFETSSILGFGKENQTVPITYGDLILTLKENDKTITTRGFSSLQTTIGVIPKNTTLQELANERSKFSIAKIKSLSLPATIEPKPEKEKIGSTNIWEIR